MSQNTFKHSVYDSFNKVTVHGTFVPRLFFTGNNSFEVVTKAEVYGEFEIFGNGYKFTGTYYFEDKKWVRDDITVIVPAKPTVVEWSYKLDGSRPNDKVVLSVIEKALELYWNDNIKKELELAAIQEGLDEASVKLQEAEENMYRCSARLEILDLALAKMKYDDEN